VSDTAIVAVTTANFDKTGSGWNRDQDYGVGTKVAMDNVYLKPGEGVVFRLEKSRYNVNREESTAVYA